jgi:hypothetical protein
MTQFHIPTGSHEIGGIRLGAILEAGVSERCPEMDEPLAEDVKRSQEKGKTILLISPVEGRAQASWHENLRQVRPGVYEIDETPAKKRLAVDLSRSFADILNTFFSALL